MTGFSALPGVEAGDASDDVQWSGVSKILGPRWSQLPALTIGLVGVQVIWSIEFAYAPPYLLSLGVSKSQMATVLLAGPISGLIMQPLIGVIADSSKSRFGRRRPYILFGCCFCVFAMMLLGFTRQFASIFTTFGSRSNDWWTIALAMLAILFIDFSVNAIQAVDRALLVDTLPTSRQASGNAWAAKMLGIGSVLGFFFGNADLKAAFPFFGNTELQVLSVLGSLMLLSMHGLTASCVREKVMISSSRTNKGLRQELYDIWHNLRVLSYVIRQICIIQFFAWTAWFPILFYTTTYIGDLHKRASPVPEDEEALAALNEEATRLGSRALFYQSLIALVANFILPYFISKRKTDLSAIVDRKRWAFSRVQIHLCELWAFSHLLVVLCMGATFFTSSVTGATIIVMLTGFAWAVTQWAPFSLLAEEILSDSSSETDEIRLGDARTSRRSTEPPLGVWGNEDEHFRLVSDDGADEDEEHEEHEDDSKKDDEVISSRASSIDGDQHRPSPLMGNMAARRSQVDMHPVNGHVNFAFEDGDGVVAGLSTDHQHVKQGSLQAKAGVILGIHNLALVMPQFLTTGLSSVIFAIFEPAKSVLHGSHPGNIPANVTLPVDSSQNGTSTLFYTREPGAEGGVNSVALIFKIGGFMTMVAFVLAWRLARELKRR